MTIDLRKSASCVGHSGEIRVDAKTYVQEKLAERRGVSSNEITYADEITNIQAHDLMADAERYFGFHGFLHESTFLKEDSHFTVLQCIKLIRLQLGEYDFLLGCERDFFLGLLGSF